MKTLITKLIKAEIALSAKHGKFNLFAAFLRDDASNLWDILVSAPWISKNRTRSIRLIAEVIQSDTTPTERRLISRVVAIEPENPALGAIQSAIHTEHGSMEVRDSNFFGMAIRHAFVITSRRNDA